VRRCPSRNRQQAAPALADALPAELKSGEGGMAHNSQIPKKEKRARKLHHKKDFNLARRSATWIPQLKAQSQHSFPSGSV